MTPGARDGPDNLRYIAAMNRQFLVLALSTSVLAGCGSTHKPASRGAPPPDITPVSLTDPADLKRLAETRRMAEDWVLANQRKRGDIEYLYHPLTGEQSSRDNDVRQWLTAYTLAHMALEHPEYMDAHKRNLDYLLAAYYRQDERGLGYIFRSRRSKLGGLGLALRALARSPLRAENPDYEDKARRLADGILSLIKPDGSFEAWFVAPSNNSPEREKRLLYFYSGEALIGLLEYAELANAPEYQQAAERVQKRYITLYVEQMAENYYPAYVPWHTLSLSHLFRVTGDRGYAEAAFRLNDKLLEILDRNAYVGRFFNPETPHYGTPHSSSDAVYTESLAAALGTARRAGDKIRVERYREALELALAHMMTNQYKEENAAYPGPRERYLGGFRTNIDDPWIRVDNTSHSADALRGVHEALAVAGH